MHTCHEFMTGVHKYLTWTFLIELFDLCYLISYRGFHSEKEDIFRKSSTFSVYLGKKKSCIVLVQYRIINILFLIHRDRTFFDCTFSVLFPIIWNGGCNL